MSERERELASRYADLRLRCAFERRAIGEEAHRLLLRFGTIDRLTVMARKTLLRPRLILAGVVGLLAFGRGRGMNTIGRLLLLMSAARRLWRVAIRLI
jgi:hypothetical protein